MSLLGKRRRVDDVHVPGGIVANLDSVEPLFGKGAEHDEGLGFARSFGACAEIVEGSATRPEDITFTIGIEDIFAMYDEVAHLRAHG